MGGLDLLETMLGKGVTYPKFWIKNDKKLDQLM